MSDNYPLASFAAALQGDLKHASFTSQDILNQEAQGQSDFAASCKMPKEGNWAALEQLGFVRGEDVDSLFCNATLPPGWKKEGIGHSMWTYIKDDRGLIRVKVFCKAAFYDQRADFSVAGSRFSAGHYRGKSDRNGIQYVVYDDGRDNVPVKVCDPVYYALWDYGDGDPMLGAVHKGLFYAVIGGPRYDEYFTQPGIEHPAIKPITLDEFWEKHHETPRHDLINAAIKLAAQEANEWLAQIPDDLSQWSEQFDFPAV